MGKRNAIQLELIVQGYLRINCDKYIPSVIIGVFIMFYDGDIICNIYKRSGTEYKIIMNKCRKLYVNSASLFFMDDMNKLYVYGVNSSGNLGIKHDSNVKESIKHKIFFGTNVEVISQGMSNQTSYVYTYNNILFGFGNNKFHQINGFSEDKISIPTMIHYEFDSKLTQISCGAWHTLFLTLNGNVYGVGRNNDSQLSSKYNSNPFGVGIQCIINTSNIIYIGCCIDSSYILNNNNILKTCGSNRFGELAINTPTIENRHVFDTSFNGNYVSMFSCGKSHVGILNKENKLYMYGRNTFQQCGTDIYGYDGCHKGHNIKSFNDEEIISVKCGSWHVIIKTNKDNYYSFGSNKNLQLLDQNRQVHGICQITNEYVHKLTLCDNKIIDLIPIHRDTLIFQEI